MPAAVGVPLIVNTPPLNEPVTPAGKAPAVIDAPVPPPPIEYVIGVNAVFIHFVCASVPAADVKLVVEIALTVIVPLNETFVQGPVVVTV